MLLHEHSPAAIDPAELDSVTECPHCAEMLYESELALHLSDECPRLHGCDVCAEPAVIRDDGEAYCLAHALELVLFARAS